MNPSCYTKKIISILFAISMCLSVTTLHAGVWDQIKSAFVTPEKPKPPTIKVLIVHDIDSVQLEIRGRHAIYDPHRDDHLATHYSGKKAAIQALPSGIKWGEEFPGRYQVHFVPESKNGTIFIDGVEYRGSVTVYDIGGGSISIVNQVDIEDYVSSTLASSIDKSYTDETLAALAIASRTQAYYNSVAATNAYWHVAANQVDYNGCDVANRFPEVEHAVVSTRYMVMSQTGTYEGVITPFPVKVVYGDNSRHRGRVQGFSTEEAESLAKRGEKASRILHQVFPNTTIELAYTSPRHHRTENVAEKSEGHKHQRVHYR